MVPASIAAAFTLALRHAFALGVATYLVLLAANLHDDLLNRLLDETAERAMLTAGLAMLITSRARWQMSARIALFGWPLLVVAAYAGQYVAIAQLFSCWQTCWRFDFALRVDIATFPVVVVVASMLLHFGFKLITEMFDSPPSGERAAEH